MQPIAVLFTVSQDELPDVLAAMAQGDPAVVAYSRGGERPLATGKLIFADSQVDQGTGHVKLKALFDNLDRGRSHGHVKLRFADAARLPSARDRGAGAGGRGSARFVHRGLPFQAARGPRHLDRLRFAALLGLLRQPAVVLEDALAR